MFTRFVLLLMMPFTITKAQRVDSIYYQLPEVSITAVPQASFLRLLSSESILDQQQLKQQPTYSLLSAVNTVPGVRMEERSPGSYRLSIRGSFLRSPFGVRNVKIYLAEFPFTDAGGNTYLNSLDIANIHSLRVLKGPEGSLFGANTGGVVLIDPVLKTPDSLTVAAAISAGSYGLAHGDARIQKRWEKLLLTVNTAYQKANGYRDNSAMERHYLQLAETYTYQSSAQLKAILLFSDMHYQTPGGLTLQQFTDNPESARPATKTLPGAIEQKAGIYNTTVFGGIAHDINFGENWRHILAITGSHTNFKNPFITNYEERIENSYGARTNLEFSGGNTETITEKLNLGAEWQHTNAAISNYGNRKGSKDTLQAADQINAVQAFLFARFLIDIRQRLLLEASVSYNFFRYNYKTNYPFAATAFKYKNFDPQLMPRFALSYKLSSFLSWRASVSGGYSAPTIAEVRASDNIINTNLQAEKGLSYETGFRLRDKNDYLWLDVAAFYYNLQHAIVRRTLANGSEYFVNAGGTLQPGVEAQLGIWVIKPRSAKFIRSLQFKSNITCNQFKFSNYSVNAENYSNNKLTGVPDYTTVESISIEIPYNLSLYAQYYYSDRIPLNDANTVYAKPYHWVQLKMEWKKLYAPFRISLFAGIDNLLNQVYSLGNDLNAAAERYYNAAAPRNYYGGLKAEF